MAGIWYGTRLSFFTISTVTVEGGETISHEEIKTVVLNELRGNYFLLIPHTFSYLYPHDEILTKLMNVSRIHDIDIVRTDHNTINVTFSEYTPYALWCNSIEEDKRCFFINDQGYAFTEAPDLHGGVFVRHSVEGKTELGQGQIFTGELIPLVHIFIERLNSELKLRVTDVVHSKDSDITLYVNGGGKILLSEQKDFDETFKNLVSLLEAKEFDHLEPGNFNYIDLRFGNKIFVNEEKETIATSTDETGMTTDAALPE